MTRRTSDENEIAVQAIKLGRAFAEAFAQLPLPRAPADRQLLDDWLERLRQYAPFDERDARAIDEPGLFIQFGRKGCVRLKAL